MGAKMEVLAKAERGLATRTTGDGGAEPRMAPLPVPVDFDPKRNERFAFRTLRERFATELDELKALLAARGVDAADPGAPAEEWGDAHLLRFVLGFGTGPAAADGFTRMRAWMDANDGASRRRAFAAGAPLEFHNLRRMRALAPMVRAGTDVHGCPVIVYHLGQLKPRQLIAAFSYEEIRAFNTLATERTYVALQRASARDAVLRRSVLILDMSGVGLNMFAPRAMAQLRGVTAELTQVYVEMVERVFFVNVPLAGWLQRIAYSLAPERSHHKFRFLGSDFQATLAEFVDLAQLPASLLTGVPPADGWALQDGDVDTCDDAARPAGAAGPAQPTVRASWMDWALSREPAADDRADASIR